jgi:hypothetical protein
MTPPISGIAGCFTVITNWVPSLGGGAISSDFRLAARPRTAASHRDSALMSTECGMASGSPVAHSIRTAGRASSPFIPVFDLCNKQRPYCGSVSLVSRFTTMIADTCKECGKLLRLSDDPSVERFFGPADDQDVNDGLSGDPPDVTGAPQVLSDCWTESCC